MMIGKEENMAKLSPEFTYKIQCILSKNFPGHKTVVAPCMADVYVCKQKDRLQTPSHKKWKFISRGVIAIAYDRECHVMKLCLTDSKTFQVVWQETIGVYSSYQSIHPTFHTLNSTKNFCEHFGVHYEENTIARLMQRTISVYTAKSTSFPCYRSSEDNGEETAGKVLRVHSFSTAPRTKFNVASCYERKLSASLTNIQAVLNRIEQNVCEDPLHIAEQTTSKVGDACKIESIKFQHRFHDEELKTTDLCTTEL